MLGWGGAKSPPQNDKYFSGENCSAKFFGLQTLLEEVRGQFLRSDSIRSPTVGLEHWVHTQAPIDANNGLCERFERGTRATRI